MSDATPEPVIGEVVWQDLTVPNASEVRDFYCEVVGWEAADHPMPAPTEGGKAYNDYVMQSPVDPTGGEGETPAVAGVCHARGSNAGMPPQWLLYVRVASLEASVAKAKQLGGELLEGPRSMGAGSLAVVRDPAGAVIGLWED